MENICGVCGYEKRFDHYHNLYRRSDLCNTKHALKLYYKNNGKLMEKKKSFYLNHKEYFSDKIKKRKSKLSHLEYQLKQITELIKTTVSVS